MPVFANSASRILSLALLTLIVNTQDWAGLLFFLIPLGILYFRFPHHGWHIFLLARKLRWFFLSIVILYFWFYPGRDILPLMGRFSPSLEGVNQAALRISSLLVVISYSCFLLLLTPRDSLVSGIRFLLFPLKFIGIDGEHFALRLGMVLSIVPQMSVRPGEKKKIKNISALIDRAADMMKSASEQANDFELNDAVNIEKRSPPGILDILIPLFLFIWLLYS